MHWAVAVPGRSGAGSNSLVVLPSGENTVTVCLHFILPVSAHWYLTVLSFLVVQEEGRCSGYPAVATGFDESFGRVE